MLNYTFTYRDTLRGKIKIEQRLRLKYNCTGPELTDKINCGWKGVGCTGLCVGKGGKNCMTCRICTVEVLGVGRDGKH